MSEQPEMTDSMADGGAASRPPAAERRRRLALHGGNLLLVIMFGVAIAAVYLLKLRITPASVDAEETRAEQQVDLAIGLWGAPQQGGSLRESSQSLVESFYKDAGQRQIPLHELQDNPFAFLAPKGEPEDTPESAGSSDDGGRTSPDQRRDNALTAVQLLELQSISARHDGTWMAQISDNLVTIGQTINGWTLTRIEPRHVVLTWGKETFELRIAD